MKSVYVDMLKTNGAFLSAAPLYSVSTVNEEKTIDKDAKDISMPNESFMVSVVPQALATKESATPSEFTKAYTAFSGCDIVVIANGKVMGEAQSITYASMDPVMAGYMKNSSQYADACMLADYPVALRLEQVVFDKMFSVDANTDLILSFANEYDQKAYMAIRGLVQLMSSGDYSIDSVVPSRSVLCAAKELIPMRELLIVKDLPGKLSDYTVGPIWSNRETKEFRSKLKNIFGSNNNYATKCHLETLAFDWCEQENVETLYVTGGAKVEAIIAEIGGCKYYV